MDKKWDECNSFNIVKNGKTPKKMQKYKCNNPKCNKYFTTSTLNKIPKTEIPFYFIIYELQRLKELKQLLGNNIHSCYYRRHFNQMYYFLEYHKKFPIKISSIEKDNELNGITRQRIYYWRKKYTKYLENEELTSQIQELNSGCTEYDKEISTLQQNDRIIKNENEAQRKAIEKLEKHIELLKEAYSTVRSCLKVVL